MVASRARVEGDARPVLGGASRGLVDAAVVAGYLGVERGWVYEHSDELAVGRGRAFAFRSRRSTVC
jgi:hypothetical protein